MMAANAWKDLQLEDAPVDASTLKQLLRSSVSTFSGHFSRLNNASVRWGQTNDPPFYSTAIGSGSNKLLSAFAFACSLAIGFRAP